VLISFEIRVLKPTKFYKARLKLMLRIARQTSQPLTSLTMLSSILQLMSSNVLCSVTAKLSKLTFENSVVAKYDPSSGVRSDYEVNDPKGKNDKSKSTTQILCSLGIIA
jgi:hypothetical protein